MSTSHIPIYYEQHLVGSITLGEFMSQPRYHGCSVMDLMSWNKNELANAFLHWTGRELDLKDQAMRNLKPSQMLWHILNHFCEDIQWEKDAILEIRRVYLTPKFNQQYE